VSVTREEAGQVIVDLVHDPDITRPADRPTRTSPVARLTNHLLDQRRANGAIPGYCPGRPLETALLHSLLVKTGLHPERQKELARYLSHHPISPIPTDLTILNPGNSPRKQFLFSTLRHLISGTPLPAAPADIPYRGHPRWTELLLAALHHLHNGNAEEHDFIVTRLSENRLPVFEGHVLNHLVALHALHRHQPRHPLLRRGIADALAARRPDGGIPFTYDLDIFATAAAGLALHAAGLPRHELAPLARYLIAHQQPNGGWSYTEGARQTDADDTTYAVQFLRLLDPVGYADHIHAGREQLRALQNDDGGIPTFLHGEPSDITMTAATLPLLDPFGRPARAALTFILEHQQRDGTFERCWSLSEAHAIFRTVHALEGCAFPDPRIRGVVALARARLTATQNSDGGWGQIPGEPSDPTSTAHSLLALPVAGPAHRRGRAYLVARQRDDGSVPSRPDLAGPRPLLYECPILASIYALWAVGRPNHHMRVAPFSAEEGS